MQGEITNFKLILSGTIKVRILSEKRSGKRGLLLQVGNMSDCHSKAQNKKKKKTKTTDKKSRLQNCKFSIIMTA